MLDSSNASRGSAVRFMLIRKYLSNGVGVYRKWATLMSQLFTLGGSACSALCVVAKSPELLMVGRVLVGVNSGQFLFSFTHVSPNVAIRIFVIICRLSICLSVCYSSAL